jgi:hypothetical protein
MISKSVLRNRLILTGHEGNPDLTDRNQSNTAGRPRVEHVYVGMLGLVQANISTSWVGAVHQDTHRVYKTLFYNLDTQRDALLDVHRDTHHPLNSIRTWHTTSIPACASSYIHAKTRKHRLFYIDHATNVCILWLIVLFHEDELVAVWEVENSVLKVVYVSKGNEVVLADSQ